MKSLRYPLLVVHLLLALAALAIGPAALSQTVKQIDASDPTFDNLQSPSVGGNTGKKSWKPKDWLEGEVR